MKVRHLRTPVEPLREAPINRGPIIRASVKSSHGEDPGENEQLLNTGGDPGRLYSRQEHLRAASVAVY